MDDGEGLTEAQQRLFERAKKMLSERPDGRVLKFTLRDRMSHPAYDALVRKGLLVEERGRLDDVPVTWTMLGQ